jgi:hypothetical protein
MNSVFSQFHPKDRSQRPVWSVALDRLGSETVGTNLPLGMDVCPRLFIIIHLSYHRMLYSLFIEKA